MAEQAEQVSDLAGNDEVSSSK